MGRELYRAKRRTAGRMVRRAIVNSGRMMERERRPVIVMARIRNPGKPGEVRTLPHGLTSR
jgi:hypothetical protein